ncbi:MAG: hypothetical protein IKE95_10245 [Methanobrevibacter sp.]|nr:hypothetical protein [Methanobrevibacter sp.]
MSRKDLISTYLLIVIAFACICYWGVNVTQKTIQLRQLQSDQIKIEKRINNMNQQLQTKDKELEQYLIKEKMK